MWLTATHAVPSGTAFNARPALSLYDHSKATAALAVALWRYAPAAGADAPESLAALWDRDEEKPFLLIQGDFFGAQDFISAEGGETDRQAIEILRGRSFQIFLFMELAALRLLELLELPPTSQLAHAAGKFLIAAPNTEESRTRLREAQEEFDTWFLRHSYGTLGISLAGHEASCRDFRGGFPALMRALSQSLEKAKHQRYDLCRNRNLVLEADFPHGVCDRQDKFPADRVEEDGRRSCALSRDQLLMGECPAAHSHALIVREADAQAAHGRQCELAVFGYRIVFADEAGFRATAPGALRRCWDFSPRRLDEALWNGCARRLINGAAEAAGEAAGRWREQSGLMALKGDVDNLGLIFHKGLEAPEGGQNPGLAGMAALFRQMNAFFAVYLPALCRAECPDVYPVFAGGDEFFLIGPWLATQRLAGRLVKEFRRYTAENEELHFSAGMIVKKPDASARAMAAEAEAALAEAKRFDGKNAFSLRGVVRSWNDWEKLEKMERELEQLREKYELSTGFMYGLLHLLDMRLRAATEPAAALWRSSLAYRTARRVKDKDARRREAAQREIVTILGEKGIAGLGDAFRIPLFNHLYQRRGV